MHALHLMSHLNCCCTRTNLKQLNVMWKQQHIHCITRGALQMLTYTHTMQHPKLDKRSMRPNLTKLIM